MECGDGSAMKKNALSRRWDHMYALLSAHGRQHGPCNVPLSFQVTTEGGEKYNLGTWLGTQRQSMRKGTLNEYQRAKLKVLTDEGLLLWGPVQGKALVDDQQWNAMFTYLLWYKDTYGHCNVPERYEFTDEANEADVASNLESSSAAARGSNRVLLGKWLENQRKAWRGGTLREDRLSKLQDLESQGLLVKDNVALDERRWQQHYQALLRYAEIHGHCNVPYWYTETVGAGGGGAAAGAAATDVLVETGASGGDGIISSSESDRAEEHMESHQPTASGPTLHSPPHPLPSLTATNVPADCAGLTTIHTELAVLKLGAWLNNQRHAHHSDKRQLRPDRLARLQALVDSGQLRWSAGLLTKQQRWDETYAALLKHCEGRTWLTKGANSGSAAVASGAQPFANAVTAGGLGAITTTTTSPVQPSIPASLAAVQGCRLLAFPGSTVLSDGAEVQYYDWLQRQLELRSAVQSPAGQASSRDNPGIDSATTAVNSTGVQSGTSEVKVVPTTTVVGQKRKRRAAPLTDAQVEKLEQLLERGVPVFRWAFAGSEADTL